jgi:hypothetical protein
MKKSLVNLALALSAAALVLSCVSSPSERKAAPDGAAAAEPASRQREAPAALPAGADYLQTMRELRDASLAAFDSNHPVEAIRHLVGLLSVDAESPADRDQARQAERAELVRKADAEITAIGARFTLEPTDEWIVDGKQVTGNVRDLAKGTGLRPSVRLVINYDFGKAVVADAPIRFAFADGIGEVTGSADTDSYGVATATVRSVARADKSAVVRAVLAVSNRGKTKVFNEVFRDFSFLPTTRVARVYAYERVVGPDKKVRSANDHSPLVDAVSRGLSTSGLEIVQADGALDPAVFASALGGDAAAVSKALSLGGRPASFLAVALAECDEPRQMTLQGKTYEIYTANARATVRLLRSDGSVVDARPQVSVRGQGGTPDAAVQAAFKAVREAVEKDLSSASAQIKSSLD